MKVQNSWLPGCLGELGLTANQALTKTMRRLCIVTHATPKVPSEERPKSRCTRKLRASPDLIDFDTTGIRSR
jgi:hypothetical protein